MNMTLLRNLLILLALSFSISSLLYADTGKTPQQQRDRAQQLMKDGQYLDAYNIYKKLLLNTSVKKPETVADDLSNAIQNLKQLGQQNKIDTLLEKTISLHSGNWRLLQVAARSYLSLEGYGYIIDGKFHRGYHRGGGNYVFVTDRDAARSIQLYRQAMLLADKQATPEQRAHLYLEFARVFTNASYIESWQLQLLTDLNILPDYEDAANYHYGSGATGTPATADGKPVFFRVPESFESANNDGERWNWLLEAAIKTYPAIQDEAIFRRARFFSHLYGVQTLQQYLRSIQQELGSKKDSVYSVRTLGEDETIARLATGMTRFDLPEEFNFIRLYQSLAEKPVSSHRQPALQALASIFENRQQYPKAVAYWRQVIEIAPHKQNAQKRLDAIVKDWGRFETGQAQVAGKNAVLNFRFRNGNSLDITIETINVDKLLSDTKDYIHSNPQRFNHRQVDIKNIGYRLVVEKQHQYVEKEIAQWTEQLTPFGDHFDKQVEIKTPVNKAGAYLITARFKNGNTSRAVLWLNDTVIVRKNLDKQNLYFVADAQSGQPVSGIKLDFFGYQRKRADLPKPLNKIFYKMDTRQFNHKTDAQGIVLTKNRQHGQGMNWLVTAKDKNNRFAYLGFDYIWYSDHNTQEYNQQRTIIITDRPVYRPGHIVKFKAWLRQASYNNKDESRYANRNITLFLHDPKGEQIWKKALKTNRFGGVDGEYTLPANATLGNYHLSFKNQYLSHDSGYFRVEEYKKPEFEVSFTNPDKPVALGDRVDIKLNATYYYGQPVSKAQVKYKIYRYDHNDRWYPVNDWDWLYGNGYWWSAYDYDWYPGFRKWGCLAPWPHWIPARSSAPELLAENTTRIGDNGQLTITLDTQLAKQLYHDRDHRYEIQAEVTDASRRTINGSTSILVTREPYKVYAWVDKGYYQGGDTVTATFKAQTPQQQPVTGNGTITLYKIEYDKKGTPGEKLLQDWKVKTNSRGEIEKRFVVNRAGQYRVALTLEDSQDREQTGAYLFNVTGDSQDDQSIRFNPLELIADQRNYSVGEKAKLLINTRQKNSTVLVFERPVNGIYKKPKLIRLDGQHTRHLLNISRSDMPNFYVEALTVHEGRIHNELREIFVPPEQRTMDVNITPTKTAYKPGEKAELEIKVTDRTGKPVSGDTVLSVYDRAVEYISGGSNVPDLRTHFWSWRRYHTIQTLSNLDRYYPNQVPRGEEHMRSIGVLGNLLGREKREESWRPDNYAGVVEEEALMDAAPALSEPAPAAEQKSFRAKKPLSKAKARGDVSDKNTKWQAAKVRKQFADTAYWSANVKLDKNGKGRVTFDMPENLTAWSVRTWSMNHGTQVGQAQTEIKTYKNLLLRMQAPRFFIEKDEVVLSANVHNYTKHKQRINVKLELDGEQLTLMDGRNRIINIDAQGEQRIDWRVRVQKEGEAIVRMHALTKNESDAMEMRFPVYVHGMDKMESYTGSIAQNQTSRSFTIDIPQARRIDSTRLTLQYSPTLAGAMIDALPYLVDYPYGCTEQTLSRFLPTVITQNVLHNMGIDLKTIRGQHNNLNSQELGDSAERRKQWQRWKRNPVFDVNEVHRMSNAGLQRLVAMQVSDGGWGWFSGNGEYSSAHTTAYVVHGLQIARTNKLKVPEEVMQRGLGWLKRYLEKRVDEIREAETGKEHVKLYTDNLDAFVYMVLADSGIEYKPIQDYLYRDRKQLGVYAKAMLALAFNKQGKKNRVAMLKRNIEQYLKQDNENETAYLELPNQSYWWYWYGSEMEAHAYYLKLLVRTNDKSAKASRLIKYLLNNRKHSTYWNSTRDTAIVIEAFAEYLQQQKELAPDMELKIYVNDQLHKSVTINKHNLFSYDSSLMLEGKQLKAGKHNIRIEKSGKGAVYYNAYLSYFSLEDYIKKAGLEIRVDRKYYKLVRVDAKTAKAGAHGQATQHAIEKYRRIPVEDMAQLQSGDLVEVELVIQSKNDYEYLVFEDMKPAGFEAVEVRSGYNGNAMGAYVEFRDERVSFFVRQLARGKHSVSYRLRAEIPGKFSALPAHGYAMYAPELRGNADEIKLRVVDAPGSD